MRVFRWNGRFVAPALFASVALLVGLVVVVPAQAAGVSTWSGLGTTPNWSEGANWVAGVAPNTGDSLVFPTGPTVKNTNNDLAVGFTVADVTVSGDGYTLGGNGIVLTGDLSGTTNGVNSVNLPIIAAASTVRQAPSGALFIATISPGVGTVEFAGEGQIHPKSFGPTGSAKVAMDGEGSVRFSSGGAIGLDGTLTLDSGFINLGDATSDAELIVHGGLASGGGTFAGVTSTGGAMGPGNGSNLGILHSAGPLALSGGTLVITAEGIVAGTSFDQVQVTGTVSLGATLFVGTLGGAVPPLGQTITIIDNDGTDAVSGTFSGLPEGAAFKAAGFDAVISYVGGDGNDVTVTFLPTYTWDGGGADDSWTNDDNWSGNVGPEGTGGETLVFPDGAARKATTLNDFPAGTDFDQIDVVGGYTLSGHAVDLAKGMFLSGSSQTLVNLSLTLADGGTISATGANLALGGGSIDLGTGSSVVTTGGVSSVTIGTFSAVGLTKTGAGALNLTGGGSPGFTGTLAADGGTILLLTSIGAEIVLSGGGIEGNGTAKGITATGGLVSPGGNAGTVRLSSSDGLDLGALAAAVIDLDGTVAGTSYDQIPVTGGVVLAGSLNLDVGFAPAPGDTFTIVDNDAGDAVTGTFSGLAQGAVVTADGHPFTITYTGGDGNDVVLTAGPVASFSTATSSVAEGDAGDTDAGLLVQLDAAATADAVVHVAITGGTATPGTDVTDLDADGTPDETDLTISAGDTSIAVPLSAIGDTDAEIGETVELTLTVVSGARLGTPAAATVTVDDDDESTVTVTDPDIVVDEGGVAAAGLEAAATDALTVSLDGPAEGDVTIHVATADGTATDPADYAGFDTDVVIPSGATSAEVPLSVVADLVDEPDETFTVRLLSATGAELTPVDVTVTIADDDTTPTTPPGGSDGGTDGGSGGTGGSGGSGSGGTGGTGTGGDDLPTTGSNTARDLAVSALLIGLGAVGLQAARRRQRRAA